MHRLSQHLYNIFSKEKCLMNTNYAIRKKNTSIIEFMTVIGKENKEK